MDPHGEGSSHDACDAARWHHARRARMLLTHPSVRRLSGPSRATALFVPLLVAAQLALGVAFRDASLWLIVVAAYAVGALLVHALAALIHECAHNLVFKSPSSNRALALLANVPLGLPGAIDFQHKHLEHHRHLGDGPDVDFQMPTDEARAWVAKGGVLRKLVFLSLGSLFFPARATSGFDDEPDDRAWRRANAIVQAIAVVSYAALFGGRALAFVALSALFAFGPHPVGVRGFGRHFSAKVGQPTVSYYGPLNWVSFNVGLHVEHHDFPAIAWHRLPRLRKVAPELYEGLHAWTSWTVLLLRFLLRSDHTIDRYVTEPPHGPAESVVPRAPLAGSPRRVAR